MASKTPLLDAMRAYVAQQAKAAGVKNVNDDIGDMVSGNYQQGPQSKAYSDVAGKAQLEYIKQLPPDQLQALQSEGKRTGFAGIAENVMKYLGPAIATAPLAIGGAGALGLLDGTALGSAAGFGEAAGGAASAAASTLPAFDTGVGGLFGSQAGIDSALASTATGLGSTAGVGGTPLMGLGGIAAPQIGGGLFNFAPAALDTLGLNGAPELTASSPAANAVASTPMAPAVPSTAPPVSSPTAPPSSGGGLLSSVGNAAGGIADWVAKNPGLASLLGGALATAGSSAGSSGSTAQQSFAKQPGLLMGTMQKPQLMQSPGTLSPLGQGGYQNSGLARFGATGGLFSPTPYQPQPYRWK